MSPHKIIIGKNTMINEFVLLDGRGKLSIGNNTSISMFSIIYSGTHRTSSDSFEYVGRTTTIGDNVWIGARSIVLAGSVCLKGCIVGAGSTFGGVAEENGIYVGNPAILVKHREITQNYKLDKHKYFFR